MVGTTIFSERIPVNRQQVNDAVTLLRRRLCGGLNQPLEQLSLLPEAEVNRKHLHDLLTQTIVNAYNNSALLLGPRGCGKSLVLERVLADLQSTYPERFSIVRLCGLLHADENCALKEIARQLCMENDLSYSKAASFSENLQFFTAMLKECALSDKALVFILEEFDLFAQRPKQCLLYNLLDAMQSSTSQIAVVGISARLDADQLLEKRVRSRFSHRKFLFLPPSVEDAIRLLQDVLTLPTDMNFQHQQYAAAFNMHTKNLLEKESLKSLISKFTDVDLSPQSVLDLGFRALCGINRDSGFLTVANFKKACHLHRPKPKLETLKGLSVLELYLLVVMNRLEGQNREVYNFNTIFFEYEKLCGLHTTCDRYSRQVCQRAFEHLLERELIDYAERFTTIEYTPVKMLISNQELKDGLYANSLCPTILHQWFAHENFK
ncbi:hypothetical protein R1flu_009409 [Riccia fluitans]|uniref:Origin of replication complex subunit 4 n=1 Tax=Riccia fluitans TaxID=41844 RepID=A0ABD1Z664_9MARC